MVGNDRIAMSHFYVPRLLKISYAPCTGCLQSWELNEPHAFDCYGCTFPVLKTEKERAVFAGMIRKVTGALSGDAVTQTIPCGRCWAMNKQCFAPPEDLVDLEAVFKIIYQLSSNQKLIGERPVVPRPQAPDDTSTPTLPAMEDFERGDLRCLKMDLVEECKGVRNDIINNYSPNWEHLQFHSGALHSRAAAESGARPDNKTKAKAAVAGFTDGTLRASKKRADEVAGALDAGSPFKRSRPASKPTEQAIIPAVKDLQDAIQELQVELASQPKGNKAATKKGQLKKQIKGKEDEIKRLRASVL